MAEFAVRREGDRMVVTATGDVDIDVTDTFIARVAALLDNGATLIEIDLDEVTFLDSSGLGALVRVRDDAASRGARVILSHVPAPIWRLFEITSLAELFDENGE